MSSSYPKFEVNSQSVSNVYCHLLDLDSASLQILRCVGLEPELTAKELEKKVHLSNAPIQWRTKNLFEAGLLNRAILSRTRTRIKPTYIYSLSPNVTSLAVKCASSHLGLDEYLKLEKSGSNSSSALSKSNKFLSDIQDMQRVLTVTVERIGDLETRLSRIERQEFTREIGKFTA